MKRAPLTAGTLRKFLELRGDLEIERIHYCYQLGSTFVNLALMEDTIINAMAMCDRINVAGLLGTDAPAWKRMQQKNDKLRSSTLGNLITILAKHDIQDADLAYLRWVKAKRDFFIHHFFREHQWPGDLDVASITRMCRRLLYLELAFSRASRRIWKIFENAGLLTYVDLGESGALLINSGLLDD